MIFFHCFLLLFLFVEKEVLVNLQCYVKNISLLLKEIRHIRRYFMSILFISPSFYQYKAEEPTERMTTWALEM